MKIKLLSILVIIITHSAQAQDKHTKKQLDTVESLREVVISANVLFGSKFEARNRTGSAYFLTPAELKQHNYTNVNRLLNTVPGVNTYEEDGFGLRPNISLRGTSPERSSKSLLWKMGF